MAALNFIKKNTKTTTKKVAPKKAAVKKSQVEKRASDRVAPPRNMRAALILTAPVVSEKSTRLAQSSTYVFKVHPDANKSEIKKAVQVLYKVEVKKVNLVHIPAKRVRVRRVPGWRSGYKKAIVSLAAGQTIDHA